ncbi:MAG: hypothetical protein P1U65_14600 [Minwuia sp.]|nr:hypothetical protein [Minwuia sp.]
MLLNAVIVLTVVGAALLLWSPRIRRSVTWRAMTTPLASIIGSGFLVLGPVLDSQYGKYAPLIMAVLCVGAYFYGAAIRYNMVTIDGGDARDHPMVHRLDVMSSWSLGFAYIVSVAYYLNLFGAFGVSLTPVHDPLNARLLTSAMFAVILFVGWTRGFKSLESMEYVSVATKLAIIAGLLVGLAAYFGERAVAGTLVFNAPVLTGWSAITLAFGLIVTVQGFETSRYLGQNYDRRTLLRSMKWSQWISTGIYMSYVLLLAYVFDRGDLRLSETAIVDMMVVVAPILPVLLVAAALAAQFSAAVADTSGSGGLVAELSANRLSPRVAYAILGCVGLLLTWAANIFEIISYASRAFAVYYTLQALIAALTAWRKNAIWHCIGFAILAFLGVLIVVFGQPVEAG